MTDYAIRDGGPADWPLVLNSWLKSHKHSGHGAKRIEDRAYFEHHHPIIESILRRARVRVAVAVDDPSVIIGYVVSEPHALHWVYVKESFRRLGIGTRLLAEAHREVRVYTYLNDAAAAYALLRRLPTLKFNPYATTLENK